MQISAHETDHVTFHCRIGRKEVLLAKTFDFTVNGHLILSTKQELNYGGVRTISCISKALKILGFVPTKAAAN
jgi:hypothetical protein